MTQLADDIVARIKGTRITARSMVELLRKAGGKPRYTEYPKLGHLIGPTVFADPDLLPWLFTQKRVANK